MRVDLKIINFIMRLSVKKHFIKGINIAGLRRLDAETKDWPLIGDTGYRLFEPEEGSAERLVIYLHGGAWVSGPGRNHVSFCERLAEAASADVFLVDYALAPEKDAVDAHADIKAVWDYVLSHNPGKEIILAGDSAGGGLALAFAMKMIGSGAQGASGLVLISPWLDASMSNEKITDDADKRDSVLSKAGLLEAGKMFAGSLPLSSPLLSPVFGNPEGLPPMLVLSGSAEIFVHDCRSFCRRSKDSGCNVVFSEYEGMFHVWALSPPAFPEAKQAFDEITGFIGSTA